MADNNSKMPLILENSSSVAANSSAPRRSKVKTISVIVHYIVRPHLPPCFSDVAVVPVEARCEDVTLCAANTLFAYCESYGAILGHLPTTRISDYGLFLIKNKNMKLVEVNRMAAACAEEEENSLAIDEEGFGSAAWLQEGSTNLPTYSTARRPTAAGEGLMTEVIPNQDAQHNNRQQLRSSNGSDQNSTEGLVDYHRPIPPLPSHPSQHYMNYERSELDILHDDFDECQPKAMMLRLTQTMLEKRRSGDSDDENLEDPSILEAKEKARVEALYSFNRNAAEDAARLQSEMEAVAMHSSIAKQLQPPEVYFCINKGFLERESVVVDEEEERGAIEIIWENSFTKLLAYAELWKSRSAAAQQFRETNAVSRTHLQGCEEKVRAKLLEREDEQWKNKLTEFTQRFSELEFGMLAQFHHMRGLRAKHRSEIENRLGETTN